MKKTFYLAFIALPFYLISISLYADKVLHTTRGIDQEKLKQLQESGDYEYSEVADKTGGVWSYLMQFLSKFFKIGVNENTGDIWIFIFYSCLAVFVIFILYKWSQSESSWFFKNFRSRSAEVSEPTEQEDIHQIDFEKVIANCLASGDFRNAIRYFYLWTLKELTDKKIIQWQPGKTNDAYVQELKSSTWKDRLRYNTYLYEFIWYGNFSLDDALFSEASQSFRSFIDEIKKAK